MRLRDRSSTDPAGRGASAEVHKTLRPREWQIQEDATADEEVFSPCLFVFFLRKVSKQNIFSHGSFVGEDGLFKRAFDHFVALRHFSRNIPHDMIPFNYRRNPRSLFFRELPNDTTLGTRWDQLDREIHRILSNILLKTRSRIILIKTIYCIYSYHFKDPTPGLVVLLPPNLAPDPSPGPARLGRARCLLHAGAQP